MSLNDQNYKIEDFQVKDLETSYLEYKNQNSPGHVDLDITDPSLLNQINDDLSINIGQIRKSANRSFKLDLNSINNRGTTSSTAQEMPAEDLKSNAQKSLESGVNNSNKRNKKNIFSKENRIVPLGTSQGKVNVPKSYLPKSRISIFNQQDADRLELLRYPLALDCNTITLRTPQTTNKKISFGGNEKSLEYNQDLGNIYDKLRDLILESASIMLVLSETDKQDIIKSKDPSLLVSLME